MLHNYYSQLIFGKSIKTLSERSMSSKNGVGKKEHPHRNEWKRTHLTHCKRINSKWINILNITPDTIKVVKIEGKYSTTLYWQKFISQNSQNTSNKFKNRQTWFHKPKMLLYSKKTIQLRDNPWIGRKYL
jgi:hypothetical protein